MNKIPDSLLDKFISGKRITDDEFTQLESLLDNSDQKKEIYQWLKNKWQFSEPEDVNLQFEEIRKQIRDKSKKPMLKKMVLIFSKAAELLFIPLLVVSLYFYFNQSESNKLLTLSTQKGEQTSVILPDGSKVWLNVDTKLSYPVNYGTKSRKVKLEGEAYFEVMKNKQLPFEVLSSGIVTKALGTSFVISSYTESPAIKSSLISGSVEVMYRRGSERLKPGQQLVYKKDQSGIIIQSFNESEELAWKNEQLIFRLKPFDEVIKDLEKWYDVSFDYNPALFKDETFTGKFKRYETLEHVLDVMAMAGSFEYRIDTKTIKIIKE
jgi:ferric-dicitrate binding protein FerR (iron transport regulator)